MDRLGGHSDGEDDVGEVEEAAVRQQVNLEFLLAWANSIIALNRTAVSLPRVKYAQREVTRSADRTLHEGRVGVLFLRADLQSARSIATP